MRGTSSGFGRSSTASPVRKQSSSPKSCSRAGSRQTRLARSEPAGLMPGDDLHAVIDAREKANELLERESPQVAAAEVGDPPLIGVDEVGGVILVPSIERLDEHSPEA